MQKAYKLLGKHRHYDWGGNTFLPNLMGVENVNHLPYAEYWMGAHALATSTIETTEGQKDLAALIKENPVQWLGKEVATKFEALPYLFKILVATQSSDFWIFREMQPLNSVLEREFFH